MRSPSRLLSSPTPTLVPRLRAVVAIAVLALATSGCARACQAAGVEVIDESETKAIPTGPIGPKGLPAWPEPLSPSKMRSVISPMLTADGCAQGIARSDSERTRSSYNRSFMGVGSARRLRGKVAIVDLRIASEDTEPWTPYRLQMADDEALAARSFILDRARERGIADLSIDVYPWFVTTRLPQVKVELEGLGRPTPAAIGAMRSSVLGSVAEATGTTLSNAVQALRARGYAEVAVMVVLPTQTVSREWADPAAADGDVDIAYVQFERPLLGLSIYVHELLHVFGADDLYRITSDPRDRGDIMEAIGCDLGGASIGDATAHAIGWTATPPQRRYSF